MLTGRVKGHREKKIIYIIKSETICENNIQIKYLNTTISKLATRTICAGQVASYLTQ
jgi:hypothetical protein